MTTFGQWLRAARARLKLTQAEMAKRLGIDQPAYSRLERQAWSSPPMISRVVMALNIPLAVEFGADGSVQYRSKDARWL
jgi:transcriptional regulator with XRE-family HTH domain